MAASQNGFCSYKLSLHKKTNIMLIMTQNIIFIFIYLIFFHREIVKLDHFMTLVLELCKHRSVMQPLQNSPFCSSTVEITSKNVTYYLLTIANIFWRASLKCLLIYKFLRNVWIRTGLRSPPPFLNVQRRQVEII
jgi:hypothetical protein